MQTVYVVEVKEYFFGCNSKKDSMVIYGDIDDAKRAYHDYVGNYEAQNYTLCYNIVSEYGAVGGKPDVSYRSQFKKCWGVGKVDIELETWAVL